MDHGGRYDARPGSLTTTVLAGLKWTYGATLVSVALQVIVTAFLARLLNPDAFGLVAMAGVFIRFGQYFAQLGTGQAVVQRATLTRRDVHSAFTSGTLLGAAFSALFVALAPLAGFLFPGATGVTDVTRVMALTFLLAGTTATTQGLLRRRFAFRAVALTEIAAYAAGYACIGLLLALLGFRQWSLVFAALTQTTLVMVVYLVLCRRDLGIALDLQSLRRIYSYGGRISFIGFGEFIAGSLDTFWCGHFLGARATGLYSRATNLATLPVYHLATGLSRVLTPAYSSIQADVPRLRRNYLSSIMVMAAIVVPAGWGTAGAAHEVVLTLLGSQWQNAVSPLAILALAAPLTLLAHLGSVLCDAIAALTPRIIITLARVLWLLLLLVVMAPFGIVGIAVAFALSETITAMAYLWTMHRVLDVCWLDSWRSHSVGLAAGAVTGLGTRGLHELSSLFALPAAVVLVAQVLFGVCIVVLWSTRARRGAIWRETQGRLASAGLNPASGTLLARATRFLNRMTPDYER